MEEAHIRKTRRMNGNLASGGIAIGLLLRLLVPSACFGQSAKEIVSKANDLLRANSSIATATMKVVKPDWSREMTTKLWMLEPDYALILITSPAKDKGTPH
jgi:hypothetical protein